MGVLDEENPSYKKRRKTDIGLGDETVDLYDQYDLSDTEEFAPMRFPEEKPMATKGAGPAALKAASGGDAGDVIGAYGMATANPYAIGAAAGLKMISMQAKRQREQRNLEYQAKLNRKERQQQAISKLVDVGRGLREL